LGFRGRGKGRRSSDLRWVAKGGGERKREGIEGNLCMRRGKSVPWVGSGVGVRTLDARDFTNTT
jgi:hypothetical protein